MFTRRLWSPVLLRSLVHEMFSIKLGTPINHDSSFDVSTITNETLLGLGLPDGMKDDVATGVCSQSSLCTLCRLYVESMSIICRLHARFDPPLGCTHCPGCFASDYSTVHQGETASEDQPRPCDDIVGRVCQALRRGHTPACLSFGNCFMAYFA